MGDIKMRTEEYGNINETGAGIDEIDSQIISLIGKRANIVRQASANKTSDESIRADERVEQITRKIRMLAYRENLNADLIESIYKKLISYYISL
jgi:isochorismate pyruvate lyase